MIGGRITALLMLGLLLAIPAGARADATFCAQKMAQAIQAKWAAGVNSHSAYAAAWNVTIFEQYEQMGYKNPGMMAAVKATAKAAEDDFETTLAAMEAAKTEAYKACFNPVTFSQNCGVRNFAGPGGGTYSVYHYDPVTVTGTVSRTIWGLYYPLDYPADLFRHPGDPPFSDPAAEPLAVSPIPCGSETPGPPVTVSPPPPVTWLMLDPPKRDPGTGAVLAPTLTPMLISVTKPYLQAAAQPKVSPPAGAGGNGPPPPSQPGGSANPPGPVEQALAGNQQVLATVARQRQAAANPAATPAGVPTQGSSVAARPQPGNNPPPAAAIPPAANPPAVRVNPGTPPSAPVIAGASNPPAGNPPASNQPTSNPPAAGGQSVSLGIVSSMNGCPQPPTGAGPSNAPLTGNVTADFSPKCPPAAATATAAAPPNQPAPAPGAMQSPVQPPVAKPASPVPPPPDKPPAEVATVEGAGAAQDVERERQRAQQQAAMAAPGPSAASLGSLWHESEGNWQGTWKRRPGTNVFDAEWTNPSGGRVSATLEIGLNGRTISIRRSQANGLCSYTGALSADLRSVQGTYGCDWAHGPFAWSATLTPDAGAAAATATAPAHPVPASVSPAPVGMPGNLEPGVNRYGSDFMHVALPTPEQCQKACQANAKCLAFSWVKPGLQGPAAQCWLKDPIPSATNDNCCVSGVVRAAGQK